MVKNVSIEDKQAAEERIITVPNHLDTMTSPNMKVILTEAVSSVDNIILDFSKTELVSSAGLRILLQAQKNVEKSGKSMTFINMSPEVMEVFDMTGVTNIFKIV